MRVKVKDLKPNPFRRIDRYPIDPEKVEGYQDLKGCQKLMRHLKR
jgi:hypothetical protein